MRNAFLQQLYQLAEQDRDVLALLADNGVIVFDQFIDKFPKQYLNYGISESEMVAAAAGLAAYGKIPFVYTMGSFLAYHCFEFIRDMVCLQNLNVKIIGTGAGVAYSGLGPTHHATEDLAILRTMPNLTLFSPSSPLDVKNVVQAAYEIDGPVYIRLGHNKEPEIYQNDSSFVVGEGSVVRKGMDLSLFVTGSMINEVLSVADRLKKDGVSACVINIHTMKPFDRDCVVRAAKETGIIISVEEHTIIGGLGGAIAELIAEEGLHVRFKRIGLPDVFAKGYGSHVDVKALNGLGVDDIYNAVKSVIYSN